MLGKLHRYSWTFVFALAVPFALWYANEGYVRETQEAGRRTRGWEAAARAGVEATRVLSRAETGMWAAVRSGGTCADYEGYSASWASGSVTAVVSFDKARNNDTAAGAPLIPEHVCNRSAAATAGDGSGGAPHWYTYALANVTTSLPDAQWFSPSLLLLSTSDTVTLVEFEMEALLRPTNLPGGTHLVGFPAQHSPTLGILSAPQPLHDTLQPYVVCAGPCPPPEPARQPGEIWSVGSTTFYRTLLLHKRLPLGVTASTARGRRLFMEWWQAAVAYVAGVAVFLVVYVVPLRMASDRLFVLARHAETIEIDQSISPETLLYSYSRPKEPAFFDEVRAVEDAYCRFTRYAFAVAACVPEAARRSSALIIAEADLVRERSLVEAAGFARRGSGRRAMRPPEPLAASRGKHDNSQDTVDFEDVERRVQISSPASAACESKESRYAPSGVCDASPQHEDSELEVQDSIMLLTQEDVPQSMAVPIPVPELVHDMSPRPFGMSVNSQPSSVASPRSSPKGSTASLSRSRLSECSLTSSTGGGGLPRRASCLSAHSAASGRDEEVSSGTLNRSSYVSMYTKGQLHRLVESDADKKQVTLANEPDPPPHKASLEVEIQLNTPSNFSDRRVSDSHGLHGLIDPTSPTRDEGKQPAARGKRGRGFSQGGLGVRPKRATVMYCEIDVLSNNTQKLEEHIELSNIMLDCVLHNLKMSDGVPVAVSGNQIVAGWNTHAPQKEHVLSGMQALWNIRQTLHELLGNDCPWAVALASGNTFSGFTGVHDTKHAVVGGETVSLCIDMIHLAPILRCRVLCNEGVYDRAKSTYDMRVVELIPLPSDPIDNGDVSCQGGLLTRENTYDQSSQNILLPGMPGEGPESDGSGGAKSHCIYDVLGPTSSTQPLNLALYSDGFAAYRARSYDQCVRTLTEHLETITSQDYQAYRVLRNALFFKQNPAAAPQRPFTRVKIGWENYEELAAGEEEEFIASFDPPLQLESAAHVMVGGGKWKSAFRAGVSAIKVSTRIAATQRRAEEDKKQEASRLKTDILKATSAAGGVSQGNEKFVIDRKGLRWSRSDKQLGVGAFGEVYQGMSEEGSLVAMKFLNLPKKKEAPTGRYAHRKRAAAASAGPSIEQATAELVNEVDLLTKLRHDNVVAYLASIVSGNQIVICMEYMSGGSLQTMLSLYKRLPLTAVSRYLTDILKGLKFLHSHNIVHRDIKPDNVLLHIDGQGKLSDFGTSGQLAAIAGKVSVQGTPMYMAPEQARGFGVAASDIWSLGITVVQLVTGAVPWVFTEQNPYMTHNFIYRLGNDTTFRPQVVGMLMGGSRRHTQFIHTHTQQMTYRRPCTRCLTNACFLTTTTDRCAKTCSGGMHTVAPPSSPDRNTTAHSSARRRETTAAIAPANAKAAKTWAAKCRRPPAARAAPLPRLRRRRATRRAAWNPRGRRTATWRSGTRRCAASPG